MEMHGLLDRGLAYWGRSIFRKDQGVIMETFLTFTCASVAVIVEMKQPSWTEQLTGIPEASNRGQQGLTHCGTSRKCLYDQQGMMGLSLRCEKQILQVFSPSPHLWKVGHCEN